MHSLAKYEWNASIPSHVWQDLYGEITTGAKRKLHSSDFTNREWIAALANTIIDSVKWSMKKWAKTKRLDWTLKIADISVRDRFPPPLTAHKRTAVGDSPTAKNSRTVRDFSVVYSSVAVFLRAIKGTAAGAVAGLLPLAWNLRTVRAFGWQI